MEIHAPSNNKLPLLSIEKNRDRTLVENDLSVKNLIDSKILLNKELNQLLTDFLGKTKTINNLINWDKNSKLLEKKLPFSFDIFRYLYFKKQSEKQKTISKKNKDELEKVYQEINQKVNKELSKLSNEIEKNLDLFEKEHKVKLDILNPVNLYLCKKCKCIFCLDRFRSSNCNCGKKSLKNVDCELSVVFKLNDNLLKFIESNIWLECGIDYLLRKKNFSTKCGCYVLGNSGIKHEIDNVAEIYSECLRILCECKNRDIGVNDVFIFSGKMLEVGCTRGYIFTTSFDTKTDVLRLARSNSIEIVERILERNDNDIIKQIKDD